MSLAAFLDFLEAPKFAKILAKHQLSPADQGPGADYFIATNSTETFNGGSGRDTVSYHKSTAGISVNMSPNASPAGGFATGDTLLFIENVIGSNYRDVIHGDTGANIIVGLGGDDLINGNGGADRLYGDAGNDEVMNFGRAGVQTYLDGGSGSDTIRYTTGGGRAEITTGTEKDLVELKISDSQNFRVVITDFQPYWEAFGNTVTEAESFRGDRISLLFNTNFGESPDDLANFQTIISGDDLTLRFNNGEVNGDIVFQDIGQWLDLEVNDGFTFFVDLGSYSNPMPV